MALYVEIKVGNRLVDVIACQRQEDRIEDDTKYHHYAVSRYKEFAPQTFQKRTDTIALVLHKPCEGAAVLAEKALHAVNIKET